MSTRTAFSYLSQQYQHQQYQWSSSCASHLARCSLFFAISSLLMTFLFKACKAKQHQLNQLVTEKMMSFFQAWPAMRESFAKVLSLAMPFSLESSPQIEQSGPPTTLQKLKGLIWHINNCLLCKRGDAKQEKYVVLDGHLLVRRVSILSE